MNANPYVTKVTTTRLCATAGWAGVLVIKPKQRAKGKNQDGEEGGRTGRESSRLVYKMQTAGQAGRMELLSKPLHYVNCLTTQITTLHRSTQSPAKTHILSVPGPSSPPPPLPLPPLPCHSPAFIKAAEIRQRTVHIIFQHHLGKDTGAKQGDTTERDTNRCRSWVSGRTSLSRTQGLWCRIRTSPALPITGFQILGTSGSGHPRYAYIQVGLMLVPFRPTHNNRYFKGHFGKTVKSQTPHRQDAG